MCNFVSGEDSGFSAGTILCGYSLLDEDLAQGNIRFHDNLGSNVGNKIWSTISKLGVVFDGKERDFVKNIEDLESQDKVKQKGKKVLSKGL